MELCVRQRRLCWGWTGRSQRLPVSVIGGASTPRSSHRLVRCSKFPRHLLFCFAWPRVFFNCRHSQQLSRLIWRHPKTEVPNIYPLCLGSKALPSKAPRDLMCQVARPVSCCHPTFLPVVSWMHMDRCVGDIEGTVWTKHNALKSWSIKQRLPM